jgi:hypothetical protein
MLRKRWIAALPLLLAACSDHITTSTDMVFDDQGTPASRVTYTMVQQQVLDLYCAVPGCHASGQPPDLTPGHTYASTMGVPGSTGLLLVAPGQPDSSYLYIKVTGGAGMRGERMPYGTAPLPRAALDVLRAWIERGAPND